jgi:hypothetical protein
MPLPTTRYVTTSDSASIAYLRVGDGPPIVFAANFSSSVEAYHVAGSHSRGITVRLVTLGWQVIRRDARGSERNDHEASRLIFELLGWVARSSRAFEGAGAVAR